MRWWPVSVSRLADGRFDVRFKLWDVVKGVELLGESLVVPAADLRLAAHRVADAIQLKLTGEPGVSATRIAYVVRAGARYALRIADVDGEGAQVALASPQPIISPAWSPDGRRLAYVSFETGKAVVMLQDVASGERRAVASFRGSNSAPAWSPDGRRLVVTLTRDGVSQLYLMDLAGENLRRLTNSAAIDTEATFSPDGQQLYFVSDRGWRPAGLPHAGGRRPGRAHHLPGRLQHQPGHQPRWPLAGLGHPQWRFSRHGAAAGPEQPARGHQRYPRR